MDQFDRRILDALQEDASLSIAELADRVGIGSGSCWRRVRRLEETGYILRRVAILDRTRMKVPTTVFVTIRTPRHSQEWLESFRKAIERMPEIVGAWRLTGKDDYLLHIVVPDVGVYDEVYKRLIHQLEFADISASISMEELKFTTAIPTGYSS